MKSSRNKTINLTDKQLAELEQQLTYGRDLVKDDPNLIDKIVNSDFNYILNAICNKSIDLLFLDIPYNINKKFDSLNFARLEDSDYMNLLSTWLLLLLPKVTDSGTIYICGSIHTSPLIYITCNVLGLHFRNRITWKRDKGRGSKTNYKNNLEDIYYYTVSKDNFTFNVDTIKLKRKVKAPYKVDGKAKDWTTDDKGNNYRYTHPSNVWTDITVPFWSMAENTEHPTQKSEKLLAKLILASTNEGDLILDPFLGSGTTAVVAKKLNRHYIGIEQSLKYSCIAQHRINLAEHDQRIQGYENNTFLYKE